MGPPAQPHTPPAQVRPPGWQVLPSQSGSAQSRRSSPSSSTPLSQASAGVPASGAVGMGGRVSWSVAPVPGVSVASPDAVERTVPERSAVARTDTRVPSGVAGPDSKLKVAGSFSASPSSVARARGAPSGSEATTESRSKSTPGVSGPLTTTWTPPGLFSQARSGSSRASRRRRGTARMGAL